MNRDAMIEALARVISVTILGKTATRGGMDAAAAVLDLCGPEPLVWADSKLFKACYSGPYTVQHEHSGDVQVWCAGIDGVIFAEGDSKAEMQSAAQSHATAAHWANTPLGKLVKP